MKPVNRVLLAFKAWDDQKAEFDPLLKNGASDEKTMHRLQLLHLQQARHRLLRSIRPDELPFMALLKAQIERSEKKVYPNLWLRLFFRLKDRFMDGPAYLQDQARQRSENMETLKEQLKERGLSSVAGRLDHHLDLDHRQVCLPLNSQLGPDKRLDLDLHFEKDAYGNFQLQLLEGTLLQKDQDIRHFRFELSDWPGLKASQALNLLEGRPIKQVYTDATGSENQRWVELGQNGVQYYSPGHPFDVAEAILVFPNITRNPEDLIHYLETGKQVATFWKHDGNLQSVYVQADPGNNTLKFFDGKQRPVTAEQLNQKAKQATKLQRPDQSLAVTQKKLKNGHRVN
ncbi:hypothetical protein DJ568_03010 [Mucilaginibacter hurinus]|uniref:DUF3945 domain-containing protein n=1 Tax=Mucilaginibacter hurinus TaxID=2201324 RepID=A0A367GU56_9SPHI|nr:hypothetical protein [Mucilaginibacter hurinus]RCH56840.1 hypothetical protein DJ568_03010 [Mucilaginibacter hurinus]